MIIFYDGDCTFCTRKMESLKQKDVNGVLNFEDISTPDFMPEIYGLTHQEVAIKIHGVELSDDLEVRKLYTGIDVWLVAHEKMGYRFVRLARLPGIYQLLKLGYFLVSKLRKYL